MTGSLFVFENEDEMNQKEAEIVTDMLTADPECYNICPGGKGGFGHINSHINNPAFRQENMLSIFGVDNPMKHSAVIEKRRNTIIEKYGENHYRRISQLGFDKWRSKNGDINPMHVPEIAAKHRDSFPTNHQRGEANSQYGKKFRFVNNGEINRKIPLESFDSFIRDGWISGRK